LDDTTYSEDLRHDPPASWAKSEHLFLVLEADRPEAGGARVSLDTVREIEIGRGPARTFTREGPKLTVRVPDQRMSQLHARVRRAGAGWIIEDCGSRNGTVVGAKLVWRHTLGDADVIETGRTFFILRSDLLAPPSSLLAEAPGTSLEGMATVLPSVQASLDVLARVSKSQVPILLLGATGTGKESLARAVHALSGRPGALVAINCAALTPNLVESQLFGHVRGAFSGALRDEPGYIRSAHQGTLFLDEIGDLPSAPQAALLRVLQEREVVAVGATRPVKVDLRVVAATHKPVVHLATRGEFRPDLLARLSGHVHELLPLAARREDLGVLIATMIAREGWTGMTFSPAAVRALLAYEWPLNARELHQCLARARALSTERVDRPALPPSIARAAPAEPENELADLDDEERALKERLVAALTEHQGNVTHVARAMGKARVQIQRWMQRFRIDPAHYRRG
jgi:DNA-binding NtrC family response regulator